LAKQKPVDSPNAVSGKVRAIEYQGTWVKITLEGASGEEFVVNMPDTEFFVDPTFIRWSVRTAATGPTLRGRIVLLGRGEGARAPFPKCGSADRCCAVSAGLGAGNEVGKGGQ
jgi:hypothetical protein